MQGASALFGLVQAHRTSSNLLEQKREDGPTHLWQYNILEHLLENPREYLLEDGWEYLLERGGGCYLCVCVCVCGVGHEFSTEPVPKLLQLKPQMNMPWRKTSPLRRVVPLFSVAEPFSSSGTTSTLSL